MDNSGIAADGTRVMAVEEPRLAVAAHSLPLGERQPVQFTGSAGEYFRIWIVNLGLTLVTVGIYSAWAKIRKRRYLYGHTRICGEGFEYRAKPLPILKGRLIAVVLLVAYIFCDKFVRASLTPPALADGVLNLVLIVGFVAAGPWFIVQSLKFNAYNTAYRNIRLRFAATYGDCLRVVAVYGWLLLLPILYPYLKRRLVEFAARNHYYGTTQFKVLDFGADFLSAYKKGYGFFFLIGIPFAVLFTIRASAFAVPLLICIYFAIAMVYGYIRALTVNAVWNAINIGPVGFQSTLRPRDMVRLYATNLAAIVLTLGLAIPWAVIRLHRYRASKTTVILAGSIDGFVQAESEHVRATGDAVVEMFDIDVAI